MANSLHEYIDDEIIHKFFEASDSAEMSIGCLQDDIDREETEENTRHTIERTENLCEATAVGGAIAGAILVLADAISRLSTDGIKISNLDIFEYSLGYMSECIKVQLSSISGAIETLAESTECISDVIAPEKKETL